MRSNKFEELLVFVTVVEHMSFTRAADKLDMVKSSVSRRVTELEQRLGVQLIQRTTRRLSLTSEGQHFYQQALQILNQLDDIEQSISCERQAPRGRIRIAASLSFSQNHLADVVRDFHETYPDITLDFDLNDRRVDLLEEGFDLAIRVGDLPDSSLRARKLGIIRYTTCASPDYLSRYGVPTHPGQLSEHKGLYYSNISARANWRYSVEGKTRSFLPENILSSNDGDFLVQLASKGLGIVASPNFIAYRYLERGQLVSFLQAYHGSETTLYAVFPPGKMQPARVRLLVDFLQGRFGDHPYWDKLTCASTN